jgi:hypothetical protein
MPIKPSYLILSGAGVIVAYSGFKGLNISSAIRSVIGGQSPAKGTVATDALITGSATAGVPGSTAPGAVPPAGDTGAGSASAAANQAIARVLALPYGWSVGSQWTSLVSLWNGESGWRSNAQNPTSTAYGIAQFLDTTWASVGATKTASASGQIAAGLKYIKERYGSPNNAYSQWLSRSPHWY